MNISLELLENSEEDLRNRVTQKEYEIEKMKDELMRLKEEISEKESVNSTLREKLNTADISQNAILQGQTEYTSKLESEVRKLTENLATVEKELEQSHEKATKYAFKEDEFSRSIEDKDIQIEYLMQSSNCMQETIERKDKEIEELKTVIKNHENLVNELENNLEQNRCEIAETNEHLEKHNLTRNKESTEKLSLEKQLREANEKNKHSEEELREKEVEISSFEDKVTVLNDEIDSLVNDNNDLKSQCQILQDTVEQELEKGFSESAAIQKERKLIKELRHAMELFEKVMLNHYCNIRCSYYVNMRQSLSFDNSNEARVILV
jgi:chromosome segregation ATPase